MKSLQELLAEFAGLSAKEVAEKLKSDGIKGVKVDCGHCPLANWLRKHLSGDVSLVQVGEATAEARIGDKVKCCHLPEGVAEFVEKFDQGRYGELVDKSTGMNVTR